MSKLASLYQAIKIKNKIRNRYPQSVQDEFNVFPGRNMMDSDYFRAVLRLTPVANQTRVI